MKEKIYDEYGNFVGEIEQDSDDRQIIRDRYGNRVGEVKSSSSRPSSGSGGLIGGIFAIIFWIIIIVVLINSCGRGSQSNKPENNISNNSNINQNNIEHASEDLEPQISKENAVVKDITNMSEVSGEINVLGQEVCYKFVPAVDGRYIFVLEDVTSGFKTDFDIYDSNGKKIQHNSQYVYDNGVLCDELKSKETYTIKITQKSGYSNYRFEIKGQKEPIDLTSDMYVEDSFEFKRQINKYKFTAPNDGTYTFYFDVNKRDDYSRICLYDSNHNQVDFNTYSVSNSVVYEDMHAGESCTITFTQGGYLGKYTVNVTCE